jgi:hypothetical protein
MVGSDARCAAYTVKGRTIPAVASSEGANNNAPRFIAATSDSETVIKCPEDTSDSTIAVSR